MLQFFGEWRGLKIKTIQNNHSKSFVFSLLSFIFGGVSFVLSFPYSLNPFDWTTNKFIASFIIGLLVLFWQPPPSHSNQKVRLMRTLGVILAVMGLAFCTLRLLFFGVIFGIWNSGNIHMMW